MVPLIAALAVMAPLVSGSLGPAYVSTVPYAVPPFHTRVDYVHHALRTPLLAPPPPAPVARVLPAPALPPYYPPRVVPLPARLPYPLPPSFAALPYPAPFTPFAPFAPFSPYGPFSAPPPFLPSAVSPPFFYKR